MGPMGMFLSRFSHRDTQKKAKALRQDHLILGLDMKNREFKRIDPKCMIVKAGNYPYP